MSIRQVSTASSVFKEWRAPVGAGGCPFLASPCPAAHVCPVVCPIAAVAARPSPLLVPLPGCCYVAGRDIDLSHRLWHIHGLVMCSDCGAYAAFRSRRLSLPCRTFHSPDSRVNWNLFLGAQLPRGCPYWPAFAPPSHQGLHFQIAAVLDLD